MLKAIVRAVRVNTNYVTTLKLTITASHNTTIRTTRLVIALKTHTSWVRREI